MRIQLLVVAALTLPLFGCANPGVVKLSPDTYMISKQDHGGIFGNAGALKADVIREANAFAESQGKVAIPVTANEIPMGRGPGQFARFDYQFRVVDKNDPEARRTALLPRPDVVIDQTSRSTVDVRVKDQTDKPKDIYAELVKLDDLRKRGIISEAEFDAQKKKLLSGN